MFLVAAATHGELRTDRAKNVSSVLLGAAVVMFLLGAISMIGKNGYADFWWSWSGATFFSCVIVYSAAFWLHSKFELPTKKHRAK